MMNVNRSNYHVAAYYDTAGASSTWDTINAVQDQLLTLLSNGFVLPVDSDLVGFYAAGEDTSITGVRLNNPQLREIGLMNLPLINATMAPPTVPVFNRMLENPINFDRVNTTTMEASNSAGAGKLAWGAVFFRFEKLSLSVGEKYSVRGTASVVTTAGAWNNGTITLDSTLPAGVYEVQGMDVVGTNCGIARLSFQGTNYRPGVICRPTNAAYPIGCFRDGKMGPFGTFSSINLPTLDIFGIGTTTTQVVTLDLVKVGAYS